MLNAAADDVMLLFDETPAISTHTYIEKDWIKTCMYVCMYVVMYAYMSKTRESLSFFLSSS